jgi:D-mannonate dehydratase
MKKSFNNGCNLCNGNFGQNKTKNNIPSKGATVDAYFDTKLPDPTVG